MNIIEFFLNNKDLFQIAYDFLIVIICMLIVLRTDKLFKLSYHQGIRYFRNAFFFFGIAFLVRFFSEILSLYQINNFYLISKILFEFFIIMAGLFLFYSLFWKKFENQYNKSSLFSLPIILFYLITIVIVSLDLYSNTFLFMFASQIILFLFASIVSFVKFYKTRQKFLGLCLTSMFLGLIAWILNGLAATLFSWNKLLLLDVSLLNLIFFLIFFYGVIKTTKK